MNVARFCACVAIYALIARAAAFAAAESETGLSFELLRAADAQLADASAHYEYKRGPAQVAASATQARDIVDFTPARVDLVTEPRQRREYRSAVETTLRWETASGWTALAGGGGYVGFTDFRSIWLNEYYRQLFEHVPGYLAGDPRGWHVLGGARVAYEPGCAFAQATWVFQGDSIAPAYEPRIGKPLLRGRDRLRSSGLRLSSENIVSPRIRALVETSVTDTTGRELRFSGQASLNWAATETVTIRLTAAGVRERPAFHAESIAATFERDWQGRWFAGLTLRRYRDSGEIIDPLLVSTAAPAMRSSHVAASLRYRGSRASARIEAGPYHTRYVAAPPSSAHFSRLYAARNWLRTQMAASWAW